MNAVDRLRTRMRDMIFGRTKIKVLNASDPSEDIVPCFLVGSFRSGTTLFRYLIDSHSEVCSPPETKFLVHLSEMWTKISTRKGLRNMGYDEDFIRQQIIRFPNSFYDGYMKAHGAKLLVDKTPEYTRILDFIDWLYEGRCRYVLIFRNGLDVAHSMIEATIEPLEENKTIDTAFEYWCEDTKLMLRWLEEHPERCHKVLYDNLCDDTENVLQGAMSFMGFSFESQQLQWYEKEHTIGAEDAKARRQRSIKKSVQKYKVWDEDVVRDLKKRGAENHRAVGYDPVSLEPF